jgi:hypothetical protein
VILDPADAPLRKSASESVEMSEPRGDFVQRVETSAISLCIHGLRPICSALLLDISTLKNPIPSRKRAHPSCAPELAGDPTSIRLGRADSQTRACASAARTRALCGVAAYSDTPPHALALMSHGAYARLLIYQSGTLSWSH